MPTTHVLTYLRNQPPAITTTIVTSRDSLHDGDCAEDGFVMAPIEETRAAVTRFLPLAALASHVLLAISLAALTGRTLYRSYLALPPSQATRRREAARRRHVKVFVALAALSGVCAAYWRLELVVLSYRVWAEEMGVEASGSVFDDLRAFFRMGESPVRNQIVRWLQDTPLYRDALEIVAEKARRAWWGEQLDIAAIAWGTLLAIEGRRRRIPYLWAFMTLSHIISLSFAQNLFYIALLLTPVPLPEDVKEANMYTNSVDRIIPPKPDSWCPHPVLYLLPILSSFTAVSLSPFAANTPSFLLTALIFRVLSFFPLLLPYIVPEGWGTVHVHPHDAHSAYKGLFRTISVLSFLLHGMSTSLALLFNTPDSYYHRHSLLHPFQKEHRTVLERSSTAIGKVLGAIGDHPAVSAVGWDVLLSGTSLGLWAANRGLDVQAILSSSALYFGGIQKSVADAISVSKPIKSEIKETAEESIGRLDTAITSAKRRPGRPKKSEHGNSEEGSTTSSTRRRGRPRKSSISDATYHPTEIVQEEGDEDEDEDWEVGALTWGLIAFAGLGTGSSGVFGAETTAR